MLLTDDSVAFFEPTYEAMGNAQHSTSLNEQHLSLVDVASGEHQQQYFSSLDPMQDLDYQQDANTGSSSTVGYFGNHNQQYQSKYNQQAFSLESHERVDFANLEHQYQPSKRDVLYEGYPSHASEYYSQNVSHISPYQYSHSIQEIGYIEPIPLEYGEWEYQGTMNGAQHSSYAADNSAFEQVPLQDSQYQEQHQHQNTLSTYSQEFTEHHSVANTLSHAPVARANASFDVCSSSSSSFHDGDSTDGECATENRVDQQQRLRKRKASELPGSEASLEAPAQRACFTFSCASEELQQQSRSYEQQQEIQKAQQQQAREEALREFQQMTYEELQKRKAKASADLETTKHRHRRGLVCPKCTLKSRVKFMQQVLLDKAENNKFPVSPSHAVSSFRFSSGTVSPTNITAVLPSVKRVTSTDGTGSVGSIRTDLAETEDPFVFDCMASSKGSIPVSSSFQTTYSS